MTHEKYVKKTWLLTTLFGAIFSLSGCGRPALVVTYDDTHAQVYRDVIIALEEKGYKPGPVRKGWTAQAQSAMEQYIANHDQDIYGADIDQGLYGLDIAVEMLGVTVTKNCFLYDHGRFDCAADCKVVRLPPNSAAPRFNVTCPGFEETLVEREPFKGELLWASIWQDDWGDLDTADQSPPDYDVSESGSMELRGVFQGIDLAGRIVVDVHLEASKSGTKRVRCYLTEQTIGFSLSKPSDEFAGEFKAIFVANEGLLGYLTQEVGNQAIVIPGQMTCLRLEFE